MCHKVNPDTIKTSFNFPLCFSSSISRDFLWLNWFLYNWSAGSVMFLWISKWDAFVRLCDGIKGNMITSKGFLYNSSNKSIVVFCYSCFVLICRIMKRLFMHESTSFPGKLTLSNRRWKKNTKWHRLSAFKRHKSVLRFSLKNSNIQNTKWHRRTHDILRCISS